MIPYACKNGSENLCFRILKRNKKSSLELSVRVWTGTLIRVYIFQGMFRTVQQRLGQTVSRIQSVTRALIIIEYLSQCKDWIGIRALSRDLDLIPSTTYRFLSTLKDLGYVKQHPTDSTYQLSSKIANISSRVSDRLQITDSAHPTGPASAAQTKHPTHLICQ